MNIFKKYAISFEKIKNENMKHELATGLNKYWQLVFDYDNAWLFTKRISMIAQ